MKKKCVIIDLDGTLCDISHRLHHIKTKKPDYHRFHDGIPQDEVHEDVMTLISALWLIKMPFLFVSGRFEYSRKNSEEWLDRHFVKSMGIRYNPLRHPLYMRPDDDNRNDAAFKESIYKREIEPVYDVIFVVDDRDQVVKKWRDLGLRCWQVQYGDY